jgi:DNA-binding NtrC family response regulator
VKSEAEKSRSGESRPLRDRLARIERRIIAKALEAVAGNRTEAARRLGLSRAALFDRLKKYGFEQKPRQQDAWPSSAAASVH